MKVNKMLELKDCDMYESLDELIAEIEANYDIEFSYKNKDYSICPSKEGRIITEYDKPDTMMIYPTTEELITNYLIDGKNLKEIATKIEIFAH